MKSKSMQLVLTLSLLGAFMVGPFALANECVPEGVEADMTAASMPAEFPAAFPLPEKYFVMNASYTPADEYNPWPVAFVELLADGSKDELFALYERELPAAGYRIVMWEKDVGATGLRVRGEGIEEAMVVVNSYDCRAYVMLSITILP